MAKQGIAGFKLRFPSQAIGHWANEYDVIQEEEDIMIRWGPEAKERGCYGRDGFLQVCLWKSKRGRKHYFENSAEWIHEVTATALSTCSERLRIEVLTLLKGVNWPTASVLLHFGHSDAYPILDFRAIWSLGHKPPNQYSFEFWWKYTCYCRELSEECQVDMRTLDRALWQYSKERQPRFEKG